MERGFALIPARDQVLFLALIELRGMVALLERNGGKHAVDRMRREGLQLFELKDTGPVSPHLLIALMVFRTIEVFDELDEQTLWEVPRIRSEFVGQVRHLRKLLPWGFWYELSSDSETAGVLAQELGLDDDGQTVDAARVRLDLADQPAQPFPPQLAWRR
jgi:hypothetical protein